MLFAHSSVLMLFALLASCAVAGRALAQLLPFRWRAVGRFYFSPALGASAFLLVSVGVAWTFGHYSSWITRCLHWGFVAAALLLQRDRKDLPRYLCFLFLFALLAGWPM